MRFHARVYGISATILILCLMFAICSCGRKGTSQSGSGDSVTFRHARLLHVEKFGNYSVARISNPWKAGETLHTYVLVPHDMPVSDRLPSGTVVKVPLQRAAVYVGALRSSFCLGQAWLRSRGVRLPLCIAAFGASACRKRESKGPGSGCQS